MVIMRVHGLKEGLWSGERDIRPFLGVDFHFYSALPRRFHIEAAQSHVRLVSIRLGEEWICHDITLLTTLCRYGKETL